MNLHQIPSEFVQCLERIRKNIPLQVWDYSGTTPICLVGLRPRWNHSNSLQIDRVRGSIGSRAWNINVENVLEYTGSKSQTFTTTLEDTY